MAIFSPKRRHKFPSISSETKAIEKSILIIKSIKMRGSKFNQPNIIQRCVNSIFHQKLIKGKPSEKNMLRKKSIFKVFEIFRVSFILFFVYCHFPWGSTREDVYRLRISNFSQA
jgi:hypothetical protein